MNDETVRVPTDLLDDIKAELDKMAKRAAKIGVDAPAIKVLGPAEPFEEWDDDLRRWNYYEATEVLITVPELRVPGGWHLQAVVSNQAGAIVVNSPRNVVPAELPADLWTEDGLRCDHCKHKRNRAKCFYLVGDDGRSIVLGSTCVNDYFGQSVHLLLEKLTSALLFPSELKDRDWDFSGCQLAWKLPEVLAAAHQIIKRFGWRSGNTAYNEGGTPTKTLVTDFLCGRKTLLGIIAEQDMNGFTYTPLTDEDVAAMIAWATETTPDGNSDYMLNVL